MIFTDTGIILLRQDFRESDRIVSLYSKEHGRLNVRLPGVSRTTGKLKALSEPFVCADYRIYIRRGGSIGTVTGGKMHHVFPTIRSDLRRLTLAFHFCELIYRLTPLHQPSEEKFNLLYSSLNALEQGPVTPAFQAAFTLRLMMLAGFGLDHPVLKISPDFWEKMHVTPLNQLIFSEPEDLLSLSKCNTVCRRFLDQYLTYPLRTEAPLGLTEDWITADTSEEPAPIPEQVVQPVY